ncbi:MAG TPA: gas vesicle protein [Nocardioidaceae bacterium]|nr:gas vesicle protein [Nocardioidaceae bacterium]
MSNSHPERSSPQPPAPRQGPTFVGTRGQSGQSLADVLERVLDKGIVIVGDIQVRLLDIELLTIKIRLMVASVERAREMGINWWEGDPFVSSLEEKEAQDGERTAELQRRVDALEAKLAQVEQPQGQRERERERDERS